MIRAALLAAAGVLAGCGGGSEDVPEGQFHVAWSFELSNGATADCGTAGIATVIAVVDQGAEIQSVPTTFDCGLYEGLTVPVPVGEYTVKLEAYKPSGNFETATANMTGSLETEAQVFDVTPFVITIPPP